MRITRVFHDGDIECGSTLTLDREASGHIVQVLRSKTGASLHVFNGSGGEYLATLVDADPKSARIRVESFIDRNNESALRIKLLQCVSRGDRMDDTIRKATELGVHCIQPVICERTQGLRADRLEKKHQRWSVIARSACEQSGRCRMPRLAHAAELEVALQQTGDAKLVLDPSASCGLNTLTPDRTPAAVTILIGPEGGLSEAELTLAERHGFSRIRFGPRVLRTETAGPAVIAAVQTRWGDMG